ncbi:hypothetical protein AMJ40_07640 [candidate division TA06 bacterium DG_26]|uniref:ATPase n=1 Tax=candidate division TA06 bacterium DG_26 TaxID=1703771 RepID=A0A0S7WDY8_UNCT6|nr:MAG: hypothetical protein AMJ40_07640 [candidate division TA06 bacterium DG_26]
MIKERDLFGRVEPYVKSSEAIVITGMRRTGKTTSLNYLFDRIDSENKLMLDLENPLNRRYFEVENYERIKSSFEVLGIDFTRSSYIFLDEIQFVNNLPSVVKYFIDHYGVKFFMTGSASFYLKNLFTESLAGRKYVFEVFPLSFREFLIFKDISLKIPASSQDITQPIFEMISPLYEEYLHFGGFPGVVLKPDVEEKKKALDEIFTSFFQLEVTQVGNFRRNEVVRDLILLLLARIGSKLDIQKLSRELGVSRPTLYGYISFLEGTYFISTVKPLSRRRNAELRKMPKVYVCDSGLANHVARVSEGRLFENTLFQSLRTKGKVNYYQRKSGVEIDFILNGEKAYEVKVNPTQPEVRRLKSLAQELGLKEFKIVSKNYCSLENAIYGFMV